MYSYSFLKNWSMKIYSATITCFIVTTLAPHGLLTPKCYTFYNKTHIKHYFVKLQTQFFKIYLSLVVTFFLKLWLSQHFIKNVSLGFNKLLMTSLIFKIGLTTIVAQQVSILRTELWKVVMNSKTAMFLYFISPRTDPINLIFALVFWIYKIEVFD